MIELKVTWSASFEWLEQPMFISGIWMEGLRCLFALQDSFLPLKLTLRSFFLLFCLGLLFGWLHLTSWMVLQDDLHQHAGKWFADATSDNQLIVDFS